MILSSGLCLLLAALCSASMTIVLRLFPASSSCRYGILLGNYLTCTVTGFLLLSDKSMLFQAHASTVLCGLLGGVLFVISLVCIQSSIPVNGAIFTSAFSKLGLLVPLLLSIVLLGERPALLQILGMVLVLASILIFSPEEEAEHGGIVLHLPLLLAVLLTNGAADAMAKLYNAVGVRNEEPLYIFLVFLCAALLTGVLLMHEMHGSGRSPSARDLCAGILVGIPNYFSSILLLYSLHGIPGYIVYPVFSSGTILIVTAVSSVFFKEILDRRQMAGLFLLAVSIILLNL